MQADERDDTGINLGYWVGRLSSAIRKSLGHTLAESGTSPAEWAILVTCFRGEANTPTSLARVVPIDMAAISRHLDKLNARGLVHRRRLSSDRRTVRVELTESGRELVQKLTPRVQANNARFLDAISEEERAALMATIQKILKHMETAVELEEKEVANVEAS